MENMSLSLRSFPDQRLLMAFVLNGNLDPASMRQLELGFRRQLMASSFKWIVDLGGLEQLFGGSLEAFIYKVEKLRMEGETHFPVGIPPKMQKVFAALGFSIVFRIFADEKGALESFSAWANAEDEESLISSRYGA